MTSKLPFHAVSHLNRVLTHFDEELKKNEDPRELMRSLEFAFTEGYFAGATNCPATFLELDDDEDENDEF